MLDRAATDPGGEGFPESDGRRGPVPPFPDIGPPDTGGVARLLRPDGAVGEKVVSSFWY